MSDIKVIEGLEIDAVVGRHIDNGCRVARYRATQKRWIECPNLMSILLAIRDGMDIAIIDTATPEIEWDKFDWDFFNQYGGLMVEIGGGNFSVSSMDDATRNHDSYELRESPFYYWLGGEQPVPDNIKIEIILRGGINKVSTAGGCDWSHGGVNPSADIIAFKLTGKVL